MLKQEITYEDWDGVSVTETLHFNISVTDFEKPEIHEFRDKLVLVDGLLKARASAGEDPTEEEMRLILECVKELMKLSYGVREGKRFIKNEQVWTEFTETPAYEAFLLSLFQNEGAGAINFLVGIMPAQVREKTEAEFRPLLDSIKAGQPTTVAEVQAALPQTDKASSDAPDFDALLAQADQVAAPPADKKPITQAQADYMKDHVSEAQYRDFMSTRYIEQN